MNYSIIVPTNKSQDEMKDLMRRFMPLLIDNQSELIIVDYEKKLDPNTINSGRIKCYSADTTEVQALNVVLDTMVSNTYVILMDQNVIPQNNFVELIGEHVGKGKMVICRSDGFNGYGSPLIPDRRYQYSNFSYMDGDLGCVVFNKYDAMLCDGFDTRFVDNESYAHISALFYKMVTHLSGVPSFIESPKVQYLSQRTGEDHETLLKVTDDIDRQPQLSDLRASIIIPDSQDTELITYVKNMMVPGDELLLPNVGREVPRVVNLVRDGVVQNKIIIIINPYWKPKDESILWRIRKELGMYNVLLYSNSMKGYTDVMKNDCIMCLYRDLLVNVKPPRDFMSYVEFQQYIISLDSFGLMGYAIDEEVRLIQEKQREHDEHILAANSSLKERYSALTTSYTERIKKTRDHGTVEMVPNDNGKLSIVIPFMYSGDRMHLLDKCISKIREVTNGDSSTEIVVHETFTGKFLAEGFIEKYNIKHLFTRWDGIFHRAWAINRGVKELSEGSRLILMDGDLGVSKEWVEEVFSAPNIPMVGWGKIYDLNQVQCNNYINQDILPDDFPWHHTRSPHPMGAAGGITYCPRDIFMEAHGIPEMFKDTWGGEDNSFWLKMNILFGYGFKIFKSKVAHMYHSHKTVRADFLDSKWEEVKNMSKLDWMLEMDKPWGDDV